ncbi:MAG: sodium:proton antiporter [marine bacterium B5-7]|nr:MAG: sodium:proton antiporter [marine bacterium B5-7]
MLLYHIAVILLALAVGIGYINHRYIKMQSTIAITSGALLISLILIVLRQFGLTHAEVHAAQLIEKIDFNKLLLNGMLSFLLFAGALTVDLEDLKKQKWEVGVLAGFSTLASAALIGLGAYGLSHLLGLHLPILYCFLFGALISPTDPIAVLATLKEIKAPKNIHTLIAGESLFNDGMGIVLFLTLYQVAFAETAPTWQGTAWLFCQETLGGLLYGYILGLVSYRLIAAIDDHKLEILLTVVAVTAGYLGAECLNVSGPLAMVVCGIFLGNRKGDYFMKKQTREYLDTFWECIDELLNALLFLLIGLECLTLHLTHTALIAAVLTIPLALFVRWLTVSIPVASFRKRNAYPTYTIRLLTWGGLRGGLAVAMALALPDTSERGLVLAMTYAVVVFAVIVQGLSAKKLVEKISG